MEGGIVATGSDERLSRVIAVINGKGGAGKTSITANMGGEMAAGGLRVLLVDTDLSGNLGIALGYIANPGNDKGKGIVQAVWSGGDLTALRDVRENLDVIPGGGALKLISKISGDSAMASELTGGAVGTAFAEALARIIEANDYDVVLIDCAPGNPELQDMALTAARYVLVPTKTDPYGWDGLLGIGPQVKKVREANPLITYLGVVLFAHNPAATRVYKITRARLDEVSETLPVFDTFIRHSNATALDAPMRGQLARELARDASAINTERRNAFFAMKKQERMDGSEQSNVIEMPSALSGSADDVAGDYERLARDVLTRIAAAEKQTAAAVGDE